MSDGVICGIVNAFVGLDIAMYLSISVTSMYIYDNFYGVALLPVRSRNCPWPRI